MLTEPCSKTQKFLRYNVDCTFNYQTNQQFDKCKRLTNFIILNECTKNHTHMDYSYQEMMRTSVFRSLFALSTLFGPKNSKCLKNKKDTLRYHHWAICAFYPIFGSVNQNLWKKEKNTWIYHHFTPTSQKSQSFDV